MEILVVAVLGLIVFGPDKLPEIARTVGGLIKQFRAMAEDAKHEFTDGFEIGDEPDDDDDEDDKGARSKDGDSSDQADEAEAVDAAASDGSDNGRRKSSEHPVAGVIEVERKQPGRSEDA
jgi:Tat protein translocase TatB subunit